MQSRYILMLVLMALTNLLRAEETLEIQRLLEAQKLYSTTLPIRKELNDQGEVTHLGIQLFPDQFQEAVNPNLWRGVERIFLRLTLMEGERQRHQWLGENNVRLYLDATPYGSGRFIRFATAQSILADVQDIKISETDARWRVLIYDSEKRLLRLSLPKDRELIYGTDKKEEDERLAQRLMHHQGAARQLVPPEADLLLPFSKDNPSLCRTPGEAYCIDSLTNEGFMMLQRGKVQPLWTQSHPKLSMRNLMLGYVLPANLTVNVTHKQYANRYAEWQTTWPQLLDAIMTEDGEMNLYAAAYLQPSKQQITGILIARSTLFGHAHMLLLNLPLAQVGSSQPATAEAMFFSCIPQNNIWNLFEDISPKRTK